MPSVACFGLSSSSRDATTTCCNWSSRAGVCQDFFASRRLLAGGEVLTKSDDSDQTCPLTLLSMPRNPLEGSYNRALSITAHHVRRLFIRHQDLDDDSIIYMSPSYALVRLVKISLSPLRYSRLVCFRMMPNVMTGYSYQLCTHPGAEIMIVRAQAYCGIQHLRVQ
jgi:hypothetical protein